MHILMAQCNKTPWECNTQYRKATPFFALPLPFSFPSLLPLPFCVAHYRHEIAWNMDIILIAGWFGMQEAWGLCIFLFFSFFLAAVSLFLPRFFLFFRCVKHNRCTRNTWQDGSMYLFGGIGEYKEYSNGIVYSLSEIGVSAIAQSPPQKKRNLAGIREYHGIWRR